MLKRNRYTLLFISWVLFITLLSLFSFSGMELDKGKIEIPFADKITHFVFYLIFSILACLFFRERSKGKIHMGRAIGYSALIAIIYGIFIEILQHTVTVDRMAEFGDILANTIGTIAGVGLIWWYFSKERQLKWKI